LHPNGGKKGKGRKSAPVDDRPLKLALVKAKRGEEKSLCKR